MLSSGGWRPTGCPAAPWKERAGLQAPDWLSACGLGCEGICQTLCWSHTHTQTDLGLGGLSAGLGLEP